MLILTKLSKSHGERCLFKDISLTINRGQKIGLIGPNGAGKTTFFSILRKETEPTAGDVQMPKNIRIGYLPQEASFSSSETVLSEVVENDDVIKQLLERKRALETDGKAATALYGNILHELEFLRYFERGHIAKKVLSGLGFKESEFERPIQSLSGGWQMRTLLAKLLVCQYDLLLLDEPTNYLDLGAALWLKDYLSNFKNTFIIISHDEDFLNDVTNYTLVLEGGILSKVKGNYRDYLDIQRKKRSHLLKQHAVQAKKRKQLQEFVYRFHAQPNKAAQVRAKKRMLEKLKPIEVPPDRRESIRSFRFPACRRGGQRVARLKGISKSYGTTAVYTDFDFEIERGEKAVLVGENGAGKSTLLKILAGAIAIDAGERIIGHNITPGYFSQTRMDVLNEYNTVIEEAAGAADASLTGEDIRTILGAFLFQQDDVDKRVSILSGGEKSRLILAKLLINPPNFLLLDEPTTHLDTDAVAALIKAIDEYGGTVVFISHDIHFVRSVANVVYEVKGGRVVKYPGSFDYYWQKRAQKEEAPQPLRHANTTKTATRIPNDDPLARKNEQKELQKRKTHNTKLAKKIKKLTKQREKLQIELAAKLRIVANPRHGDDIVRYYESLADGLKQKITAIDKELARRKEEFL